MTGTRPPRRRGRFNVDGRRCDWVRDGLLDGRPLLVLAHGAGAGYESAGLTVAAEGLASRDVVVVRFQFPYMQLAAETGQRRPPDRAPLLLSAWRAMLASARRMRGVEALVLGGRSMGGRMASMLLADGGAPQACGALYLGYPLHPAKRPETLRTAHLSSVPVPQMFISGDRDALAELPLLTEALRSLRQPPAQLHVVPGGDHGLVARGPQGPARREAWLDAAAAFVHQVADNQALRGRCSRAAPSKLP